LTPVEQGVLAQYSPEREVADIDKSRRRILEVLVGAPDITFVRSIGNIGDELIWAGTRQLLAGVEYREVGLRELAGVSGHTAVLAGGGAWSRPYHEVLPAMLPELEKAFERVIVLPSSFDVSVEAVRAALSGTDALVFAREHVSYEQIRKLCRAEIAHDCAFFFDFSPYRRTGSGVLTAYREDRESPLWGEIYVSEDGGEEALFAAGIDGVQDAPWIRLSSTYRFRLYLGTDRERVLAQIVLSGAAADSPRVLGMADRDDGTTLWIDGLPVGQRAPGTVSVGWRVQSGLPKDNVDISASAPSLDAWLWTIARHERVRTDRAHVMIAAAMLGKTVEYRASSTHKVGALVEYALSQTSVVAGADGSQ